jgi:glycine betaine/proline transport system ATP-binding protein
VQSGRPDAVVGPPPHDYVKEFVSDVPKSHVLTLRWVMRPVSDDVSSDSPVLSCDTIVREAAREVLAAQGPVRVAEGDRIVGVVDDEDILRVVVAEEG